MRLPSDSGSEDLTLTPGDPAPEPRPPLRDTPTQEKYDDDVCRDFMRNTCTRGRSCRFRHPRLEGQNRALVPNQAAPAPARGGIIFCHDFQNAGCTRPTCRFLHCSRDEEESFNRTGLLPPRLNHTKASPGTVTPRELPLCRDFLNEGCKRGKSCRFRHEFEEDRHSPENGRRRRSYDEVDDDPKRRRLEIEYGRDKLKPSYAQLEEDNMLLRRKVEELTKQVSDLTAIKEVLLDQNARYRVAKTVVAPALAGPGGHAMAMAMGGPVVSPSYSGAMVVSPSLTQQVALNSSLTQQVALNSDLATQHAALAAQAQQQRLQPAAPTAITQNMAAAPLGLTQTNLAVSMATMGPAALQVPQVAPHSLTQNLGAPSTSLMSYPIMSQNMRSAVEPSSMTH